MKTLPLLLKFLLAFAKKIIVKYYSRKMHFFAENCDHTNGPMSVSLPQKSLFSNSVHPTWWR
jgi:hypothetical protein